LREQQGNRDFRHGQIIIQYAISREALSPYCRSVPCPQESQLFVVGRLMDQKHMMVDYYIIVVSEFFGKKLRIDLVALHNIEGCAMLGLCTNPLKL